MYSDPNMLFFSTVIFNVDNDDVSYLLLLSLLCYVLLFYACDTKCAALGEKKLFVPTMWQHLLFTVYFYH